MQYKEKKAIYLQIADRICESIAKETWKNGDRIPSIREMAVDAQVNPNTMNRTYSHLQELGIIHNQRGIGYFISPEAADLVRSRMKEDFVTIEIPSLFRRMNLLKVDMDELKNLYVKWNGGRYNEGQ